MIQGFGRSSHGCVHAEKPNRLQKRYAICF